MADPLSSAASVAGLVSLGLQVCGGVSTYLDAIQGRDDDFESARQNAKNVEDTVRCIEQFVPQLQANHQIHAATISNCVQSCRIQLDSLQDLLHKLGASPTSSGSFWGDVRSRQKKLTYPFQRSNLDRLEIQLGKVNGTLQTALQVLEIRGQQTTNTILAGIENVTRDTPAELRRMSSEIATASSTLRGVDNALSPMRDAVAGLGSLLTSKADETSTQLARMESSIDSSMLVQQALLANAVSAAVQRNAAQERILHSLRDLLLRRLVSVPSALKEFSDQLVPRQIATAGSNASITRGGQPQVSASSLMTTHSGCLCPFRRNYQKKQIQWGQLRFYNQALVEERHLPSCPRRNYIKDRRKQKYGVTYTGLVRIMNMAIDLSYSMCFGAGGWSISREFKCISTVDYRTAPVFRLMEMLHIAGHFSMKPLVSKHCEHLEMTKSEWKDLLDSVLGKIRWLFDNRLGCPDDVNQRNQTVMFLMLKVILWAPSIRGCNDEKEDIMGSLMGLLEVVRYYDIPVFSYDNDGCTAFIGHPGGFSQQPSWTAPIIDAIISPASEILPVTSHNLDGWVYECGGPIHNMVSAFRVSQTYAESWGCGPLSLAIVAEDMVKVGYILRKHPTLLKEVNLLGQTPFHLAAGNPTCLSLLLEALRPDDRNLLDHRDVRGNNALVYALGSSLRQCRSNSPKQKCRGCTCASSLVMLLKTNACSLPFESIARDVFEKDTSLRCKIKLIIHMKRQGEILREVALDCPFWTSADTEACNLHSTDVLDAYASSVISILKTNGIQVNNSIKPSCHDSCSVYHFIRNAADAQEFYRRGFRDVAVPNDRNLVPLDMAHLSPSYLCWLVEHGAPLTLLPLRSARSTRSIMKNSRCGRTHDKCAAVSQNSTHAHDIAFRAGTFVTHELAELRGSDFRREECSIKLLSTAIVPADLVDDCNCPCSDRGCTPWIDMIKGLCGKAHKQKRGVISVPVLAARFLVFLRMSHQLIGPSHLRAAIRFLTFSGLGMTHACCWPCIQAFEILPDFHRLYTHEETHEIRELESTELEVLEGLVTEFSEQLNLQSSSFSANLTLLEDFWHQYWVPRVEEAVERLRGAADYETDMKGARELGVIWENTDNEEDKRLSGYTYWANEIDKVMANARWLLEAKNG